MEGFWSLRMNDAHDSYPMGMRRWTYGLAPFKRDHPQYMMGEPEDWERCAGGPRQAWSHLDFDLPQVREHVFALIEEVYQGYDVDGVELDFLRSSPYFRESLDGLPVAPEHLDLLTELVRRVRQTADAVGRERGRPLLLAVRAPFTADAARFIGLDLERWLSEDLVDILVAGYST
jgi:hypothetical protein